MTMICACLSFVIEMFFLPLVNATVSVHEYPTILRGSRNPSGPGPVGPLAHGAPGTGWSRCTVVGSLPRCPGMQESRILDQIAHYFQHEIPAVPHDDEDVFLEVLEKAGLRS